MRLVARALQPALAKAARAFPAVVLTGPRRAGKTTLLRHTFKARYMLLEDPDIQARARSDPRGLLDELTPPVIFDEIQHVPELFAYIRTRIDAQPRRTGQWFFTGSQEAPLMRGVSESMAGRAAILHLLPFSVAETPRVTLLSGGFPEAVARPRTRRLWFSSYVQTYLERDLRSVTNVRDLATFRRFLGLVASRHGQVLNKSDIAAPLGVSVPTVTEWLGVLELTGQIILVPPYFENFGKRIIKSPKIYMGDSGLACHLLGILSAAELERSPFLGALFEGFVASEIVKAQTNAGGRKEIYHFRDQQGLEVDLLSPAPSGRLWMIECKATRTPRPAMAAPILALRRAMDGVNTQAAVVHREAKSGPETSALAPDVRAMGLGTFLNAFTSARIPKGPTKRV
jgi:predicted AAA+ superfamily ATPase